MPQAIKDTEVHILREFSEKVAHLRYLPADQEMQSEMLKIGGPFLERLKSIGIDWSEAITKMRKAFDHQPLSRTFATPQPGVYAY